MSITLQNPRFGSDLRQFDITIPPTVSSRGLPSGLSGKEPPHPFHYTIELEPVEVGTGRIGRVFRGIMKRQPIEPMPESETEGAPKPPCSSAPRLHHLVYDPSEDDLPYIGPGEVEHVVVKLVAPLARMKMRDNARHHIYHPSMRSENSTRGLLRDLYNEARTYAQFLGELQGVVVPRFYGHAVSKSGNAALMVLEDCGQALGFSYQRLPLEDR